MAKFKHVSDEELKEYFPEIPKEIAVSDETIVEIVNCDFAKVRKIPGGEVVFVAKKGDKFLLLFTEGDWVFVSLTEDSEVKGFVAKVLIKNVDT